MSSRNIMDLTCECQDCYIKFREAMTTAGLDFAVICTLRSQKEQDILYAQGRTTPGKIVTWTHNSKHTTGQAFDIEIIVNGKGTWQVDPYYIRAGEIAKTCGLYWGGAWYDNDHFQCVPKG